MNNFIFSQTVRLFPPSVSYSSIILERADHLVIRTDFRESQFRPRNFPIFTRSYLRWGGPEEEGAKISEGMKSEPPLCSASAAANKRHRVLYGPPLPLHAGVWGVQ